MYLLNNTTTHHIASPAGTYVYDIVPVLGDALVSISSDDQLRVLDPARLDRPPVRVVQKVHEEVTCLKALTAEQGVVVTAGRDGVVRIMDVREGKEVGRAESDQKAPILSLACLPPYGVAAGTELTNHEATVSIWDTRNLGQTVRQYIESHSDDVTELQFHPTHPSFLLSGSTDGLVNIYNTTIADEEEALHQTINHGSSIHRAGFLSDTDIFALSHDEKFSMYELVTNPEEGVEEPPPVHFGDLRELLGGEYVANVVRRADGGAVVGVGTHSHESFDLVHFNKNPTWTFAPESKVTLLGGHGSEIVRSFCFLDTQQTVLTAGEDGMIKGWKGDQ
ncbi:WD repeat-containing protein [Phlyctema vagabunda]|uniref:WD repeat-containing protein n=1 Tax=Phlyctema vagabunda TaxID=108571 RepID=A0ABR4PJJ9_9HELO